MPSSKPLDVVGAAEIAELLGAPGKPLSRQRVSQLTAQPDFPKPAARLRMGSIWWTKDVRDWAAKNRPTEKTPGG